MYIFAEIKLHFSSYFVDQNINYFDMYCSFFSSFPFLCESIPLYAIRQLDATVIMVYNSLMLL